MKLLAVFLLAASLHLSANTYSQKVTYKGKEVTLKQVFTAIKKQTGYTVFVNVSLLDPSQKISLSVTDMPLEKLMGQILDGKKLTYSIQNKTIVISPKEEISVPVTSTGAGSVSMQSTPPPNIDVKGRVVNEKGEPLAGVSVLIKGTKRGASTNENGFFELKGVDENAVLVFSGVNIETYEAKVNGKAEMNFTAKTKVSQLQDVEITVNTGYQNIPKERATGSFAQPDKRMFEARVSQDLLSRLEGITSGLAFNRTATGQTELNIRSRSTIYANSQPLIVIDNFPYDGDLNNINPNDIEAISVLKDAASASIWGVRAANGVIVVTTKKGRLNQPLRVELNSNLTFSERPDIFYDPNFMKSTDFVEFETFLFDKGFYNSRLTDVRKPFISSVVETLNSRRQGLISSSDSATQINRLRDLDIRNDISKYLYRPSIMQQYALSISGGSEKITYNFFGGYDKVIQNVEGNSNNRVSLSIQNTYKPINDLQINTHITYTESLIFNNGVTNLNPVQPYAQLKSTSGDDLPLYRYRQSYIDSANDKGFLDWRYYPLREVSLRDNRRNINDIRLLSGLKYELGKGLSVETNYQYERQATIRKDFRDQESYFVRDLINQFATVSATTGNVLSNSLRPYNVPIGGILDYGYENLVSQSGRGQLNYNYKNGKSALVAIVGLEAREIKVEGGSYRLYGYDKEVGTYSSMNYDSVYRVYPTQTTSAINNGLSNISRLDRFQSFFSNVSYNHNGKYTFSLSGRIDKSNYFGVSANQRSVPLWSAGVLWDISRESFYKSNLIPLLKFRLTYGYNGNLNKTVTAYTTARYAVSSLTNLQAATIISPPNSDLRWEKTGMLNVGIDFGFAKNSISGTIEYYYKRGLDIIGDNILAPSVGFMGTTFAGPNAIRGNYANMTGNGLDLELRTKNINRGLSWSTSFVFSYAKEKVTRFAVNPTGQNLVWYGNGANGLIYPLEQRPVYGVYSYRWAGLDPNTGEPRGYLADTVSKVYASMVNLSATQLNQVVYNGPSRPTFFGGMTNYFSWKGFTLSANISFKLGYYFRRSSVNYFSLFNSFIGNKDFSDRWQKPGDERNTNVPALLFPPNSTRDNFYTYSEVLVEKGDHIRLQDISISYTMDKNQWRQLPISNLQLYVYVNNIGILWRANSKGIDPDYSSGVPPIRTISVGIKTKF